MLPNTALTHSEAGLVFAACRSVLRAPCPSKSREAAGLAGEPRHPGLPGTAYSDPREHSALHFPHVRTGPREEEAASTPRTPLPPASPVPIMPKRRGSGPGRQKGAR